MTKKENGKFIVDGFAFRTKEEAELAKKEVDGVKYIRGKTDMAQPDMVLQIYNKMIEQNFFETSVGYVYLRELQEYLQTIPHINNDDILPIPIKHPGVELEVRKERVKHRENQKKLEEKLKTAQKQKIVSEEGKKLKISLLLNLILVICVIGMFLISMTSSNPNIVNYESKLIDKYAGWEQELTERENNVKALEQELENQQK